MALIVSEAKLEASGYRHMAKAKDKVDTTQAARTTPRARATSTMTMSMSAMRSTCQRTSSIVDTRRRRHTRVIRATGTLKLITMRTTIRSLSTLQQTSLQHTDHEHAAPRTPPSHTLHQGRAQAHPSHHRRRQKRTRVAQAYRQVTHTRTGIRQKSPSCCWVVSSTPIH